MIRRKKQEERNKKKESRGIENIEKKQEARSKKQDFVEFKSPIKCDILEAKSMIITKIPIRTTYIKSYNHDKYSRLEPSQGLNPARVGKNLKNKQLENGQH